jgi:hypothetical protein
MIFFFLGFVLWTWLMIRSGRPKVQQKELEVLPGQAIGWRKGLILILSLGGIVVMGYGITQYDWGYNEMSSLFL